MGIRIVKPPPGDAPQHVRTAWVGLVLPLAAGEIGPRREVPTLLGFGYLRRVFGVPRWYYVVSADAALNVLERAAPAAAAWWRVNAADRIEPGQTLAFPAWACETVIRLVVGARTVFVGTRPVPSATVKGFRPARLRREGADRLALRPTGWRLFSLIWFFAGVLSGGAGVGQALAAAHQARGPAGGFLAAALLVLQGIAFVAIGVGCLVSPRTYQFERAAGVFRINGLGSRRDRPLREVVAVQLLGHQVSGKRRRTCYQLNLVLLDDRLHRLCLSDHDRWEATQADGVELANFLGVPLLDGIAGARARQREEAPRTAEASSAANPADTDVADASIK